jgi:ribose/xylose/arabinose/galactoside ABC-type transport system permease subunit
MLKERPRWTDVAGALCGVLLAVSLFLPTYEADPTNPNATFNLAGDPEVVSIWQIHDILRWLLLAAAIAPIVLLYIIIRGHQLSWPRGEMTAVIGLTVMTLVLYVGVIDRPGEPSGAISIKPGWFVALVATIGMAVFGAIRATESGRRKKPPGVL